MAQVVCFDLDGVLSLDSKTNHSDLSGTYAGRIPNDKARSLMKKAYMAGYTVIVFTGRREINRRITEDWLALNDFHYHFLLMGKPYYTVFIDDRVAGASVDQQLDALDSIIASGAKKDTNDG